MVKPSRYNALLQEKADLIAEAKGVFEKAEGEERELTAEEQSHDDETQARLEAINPELDRIKRQRERECQCERERERERQPEC